MNHQPTNTAPQAQALPAALASDEWLQLEPVARTLLIPLSATVREMMVQFQAVFNSAAVGMSIVNIRGQFLQCNQKVLSLFGYSQAE